MARQFIEQRGRAPALPCLCCARMRMSPGAAGMCASRRKDYLAAHPEFKPYQMPPGNISQLPRNSKLRWFASALSGKYFQQHAPVREQSVPVGHSVRFAYLETAIAMLARASGDLSLLPALEAAWERMLLRRMYVTGGIGSLPGLEGFGNDYELDPETAYAETCAALAACSGTGRWRSSAARRSTATCSSGSSTMPRRWAWGWTARATCTTIRSPAGEVTRKPWYAVPAARPTSHAPGRTWVDISSPASQMGELCTSTSAAGWNARPSNVKMAPMRWRASRCSRTALGGRVRIRFMEVSGASPRALRCACASPPGLPACRWRSTAQSSLRRWSASRLPMRPLPAMTRARLHSPG